MSEQTPARAVHRTMQLIEVLAWDGPHSVSELVRKTGMHKSTISRFLGTLASLGYVRRSSDGQQFALTLKLLQLHTAVLGGIALWRQARPVLQQLAERTKETIHLAIRKHDSVVYVHRIESPRPLRVAVVSQFDETGPMHCTAVGKVLLAFLPEDTLDGVLGALPLRRYTPNTITDYQLFRGHLREIHRNGVAFDREEYEIGVSGVAVPLLDGSQQPMAALSISLPTARADYQRLLRLAEYAAGAASEIRERIGDR